MPQTGVVAEYWHPAGQYTVIALPFVPTMSAALVSHDNVWTDLTLRIPNFVFTYLTHAGQSHLHLLAPQIPSGPQQALVAQIASCPSGPTPTPHFPLGSTTWQTPYPAKCTACKYAHNRPPTAARSRLLAVFMCLPDATQTLGRRTECVVH